MPASKFHSKQLLNITHLMLPAMTVVRHKLSIGTLAVCSVLCTLSLAACETAFDPFEEADKAFSVMGYLDASMDTQVVRVELLQDSLLLGAKPELDAAVWLQDLSTGVQWQFKDSLTQFGEDVFVHNYWSVEPVKPGGRYQFMVESPANDPVTAAIAMPEDFELTLLPNITCVSLERSCVDLPEFQLDFQGLERAAAMLMIYRYPNFSNPTGCTSLMVHYWEDVQPTPNGSTVTIKWREDLLRLRTFWPDEGSEPTLATMDVFVAAGGPEWPDFAGIDRETLFIPEIFTNIENGIGFLGGVLSHRIRLYDDEAFCDVR